MRMPRIASPKKVITALQCVFVLNQIHVRYNIYNIILNPGDSVTLPLTAVKKRPINKLGLTMTLFKVKSGTGTRLHNHCLLVFIGFIWYMHRYLH